MSGPKDVFEGATGLIKFTLTGGKAPDSKTAKIVFDTTGSIKLDPIDVKLPAKPFLGKAKPVEQPVQFPEVPAAEDSYEVGYHIEWNKQQVAGTTRWRVWPDTVDVTTKKKVDGKLTPVGFITVNLVQGEQARGSMMPSTGKSKLLITQPAPFSFRFDSPVRFLNWLEGKDKGRERVLEYDIAPYVAGIATPPGAPDAKTPVYVNTGMRNEVKFTVVTGTRSGDPAPNQDVYVEINFTNPTKRGKSCQIPDADYAKERTATMLSDVQKSNENMTWKGKVKTGNDAKADFLVFLGKGGGETCEVKVGSTPTVEDASRRFETWRRLYLQHSHSGTGKTRAAWPADKRQATIDSYKEVFVELEFLDGPDNGDVVYPDDMTLGDRCGWVDGAEIGGTAGDRCFVVNTAGRSWMRVADKLQPTDAKVKDLFINVAACDLMYEVRNGTLGRTASKEGVVALKGTDLSKDEDDSLGGLPNKPIYQTRARYVVRSADAGGRQVKTGIEGDVPAASIKVSSSPKGDRGTLTIQLPRVVVDKLAQDPMALASVSIDWMMKVKGGGAVGVSDGAHSIILGDGACGDAETNNTVIHEIGHCIGMCGDSDQLNSRTPANVVNRLPDYTLHQFKKADGTFAARWSYKEHSRWYDERGHQGDHCATGLGDSAYKKWGKLSGRTDARNVATYTCVIYGASQLLRTPVSYCPECQDLLKAMELWVGVMPKT